MPAFAAAAALLALAALVAVWIPARRAALCGSRHVASIGVTGGRKKAKTNSDQLHGALDMLVLKMLADGPLHGYAIAVRLERLSNEILAVEEGSLYPALYRMESRGWLSSEWALTDTGRRARFYRLTRAGRAQLTAETESWLRLTAAGRCSRHSGRNLNVLPRRPA